MHTSADRDTKVLPDITLDVQVLVGLASACNSGADPGALRTSVAAAGRHWALPGPARHHHGHQ